MTLKVLNCLALRIIGPNHEVDFLQLLKAQKKVLRKALHAWLGYKVVVLGDREFCSVDLARWLGEQADYFCLRQK